MQLAKSKKQFEVLDVTSGPILIKMIKFAIPVFLSGILQQAFNTADSLVIGRYSGSDALAGISATSAIINLLVNFFMGLSVGAGVAISQHMGASDTDGVRKHAHNSIATAIVCGVILAVLGNIVCRPVLELMKTPVEIIDYSEKYMRIYFAGVPFILLYNYGSAIMRAMGDTKRPLFYLTMGGIANVILNLIFVIEFGMDADGVAIATVVSNVIAAVFVMYNLTHSHHACKITLKDIRIRKNEFKRIMSLGLPTGIQSSMFSVSNMLMQSSFNSYGASFVAGNAAAANLDHYTNYIGDAFVQAAVTFSGQNFGAGNYKRIKKIFIESLLSVILISLAVCSVIVVFRYPLAKLFVPDNEYALQISSLRTIYICGFYFVGASMSVASANIRAMGKSFVTMIVTVFGVCVIRIVWVFTVFSVYRSPSVLYAIYPISWFVTAIAHVSIFIYYYRKMASGKMKMKI